MKWRLYIDLFPHLVIFSIGALFYHLEWSLLLYLCLAVEAFCAVGQNRIWNWLKGRPIFHPLMFMTLLTLYLGPSDYNAIVIGAGLSGITAAVKLKELGIPFVILEKGTSFGGTWFKNTYPGCGCDAQAHKYCLSFYLNPW